MKLKLLISSSVLFVYFAISSGFSVNNESPKWNIDPRTRVDLYSQIRQYAQLPVTDYAKPVVNESDIILTTQGEFIVNSPFRVHPINYPAIGHQTEVPITRHPANPLIMFGSAITSGGGNFSSGCYVTTNGGDSWYGNDTLINNSGLPVFNYGDPAPVIDGSGRFLISYITLTGQMGASFSTNNGLNWSNTITFPGSSTTSDKNFSSTNDIPGNPFYLRSYTYFTEFGGGPNRNRIVGTYTDNQGVSWTSIVPVSPVPSANHFHQGADTKIGPEGEVYVVWVNSILINPYTEDSLGFAKSTDGGVTWIISRNNAADLNGNRTYNMMNNIRATGFPRIDVDRTCGPRRGWIYVCTGEKNPGVAGDISDITLYKSTDGGNIWSSGVRVNQDAFGNGSKQYMGAIRVDESGGVNVVYYDTRNTPTGDSAEVFLSRSTDGGATFTDIKVGDKFKHAPTGIPGVNELYAGDYIGITSALIEGNPVNGNQRIWPYWMANNTGLYNAWTVKVEILPSNPCSGCEDFSGASFTPGYYHLEYSGNQYWSRQEPGAYGADSGSAKFDFYNASAIGESQSLVTNFEPITAGYYLTFDEAYAPYGPDYPGPDSLYIESSTNNGVSFTLLAGLSGKYPDGGELNTAPATTADFSPASSQWTSKIYALPSGTNRVRLRAVSGFGNNLYIDNICIQPLPNTVENSISIASQGMWIDTDPYWRMSDTVRVYLYRTDFPNIAADSATGVTGPDAIVSGLLFKNALSGSYYKVVKHRNSIETWSSAGVSYDRSINSHYNFITPEGAAFGNNQAIVNQKFSYRGMYSGDIEQNGFIDLNDVTLVYNDANAFVTGYVNTDVTGDSAADLADLLITYNNNMAFISVQKPLGANPFPVSFKYRNDKNLKPENKSARSKNTVIKE